MDDGALAAGSRPISSINDLFSIVYGPIMKKAETQIALLLIVVLAFGALAQQRKRVPMNRNNAGSLISENALRGHIKYLSDDLLEGRGTGARGGELAAKYIAAQFESLGLKGAGANGSYF